MDSEQYIALLSLVYSNKNNSTVFLNFCLFGNTPVFNVEG
jgi:hypothetical protein